MSESQPPGQGASVYRIGDRLIVHSMDRATSGVWITGTFVAALSAASPATGLGAAVEQALAESRDGVPHPQDGKAVGRLVLDAAGQKSWRALQKRAVLVEVWKDSASIRIVPTRNGGTAGDDRGFHELPDREAVFEHDTSRIEIAEAVAAALDESH